MALRQGGGVPSGHWARNGLPAKTSMAMPNQLAVCRTAGRNESSDVWERPNVTALHLLLPVAGRAGVSERLNMKKFIPLVFVVAAAGVAVAGFRAPSPSSFLFVWAGANDTASDFLAVIDADPASPHYGGVVASLPVGAAGTHPHHTEAVMPADGHLLANGFHAGKTWLFDLTKPEAPRIITSFGDLAGLSHPHTYVRLADNTLLTTFQYSAGMGGMAMYGSETTGGLVQMDERGTVIRSGSARDTTIADRHLFPYSVLPIPALDVAVSTTTNMDPADTVGTDQWVQIWRLSDLKLRKSIALPPGPGGSENQLTGEPFLLPDGHSVYIHTFHCGLYLLRGVETATPTAELVKTFPGVPCGVPILTGHWWLQTVSRQHELVALDISDAEHPREVSQVSLGDDETPHWMAIDPTGRRLVVNSGGYSKGDRLFIVNFDPANGALSVDERFKDPGDGKPGLDLRHRSWPHGYTGRAAPHGAVFSR